MNIRADLLCRWTRKLLGSGREQRYLGAYQCHAVGIGGSEGVNMDTF